MIWMSSTQSVLKLIWVRRLSSVIPKHLYLYIHYFPIHCWNASLYRTLVLFELKFKIIFRACVNSWHGEIYMNIKMCFVSLRIGTMEWWMRYGASLLPLDTYIPCNQLPTEDSWYHNTHNIYIYQNHVWYCYWPHHVHRDNLLSPGKHNRAFVGHQKTSDPTRAWACFLYI